MHVPPRTQILSHTRSCIACWHWHVQAKAVACELEAVLEAGHASREGALCVQAVFRLLDVLTKWVAEARKEAAGAPPSEPGLLGRRLWDSFLICYSFCCQKQGCWCDVGKYQPGQTYGSAELAASEQRNVRACFALAHARVTPSCTRLEVHRNAQC